MRRFFDTAVFNTVQIQRDPGARGEADPVAQMAQALGEGASLILFPEGRRNDTEALLLPLKSGLFHLASARPEFDLVPAWIDNLNGVMPRGGVIPVPLFLDIPGFSGGNLLLMVFLVAVVQGADLAQHFWSACIGLHPIAPAISRSRTWEGFAGGVATAAAIGAGLC